MYGFTGQQSDDFIAVVKPWAEKNNIDLKFSPTANFNQLINTRVQGNQLPDVAVFPQPGVMRGIAKGGKLADLSDVVDLEDLKTTRSRVRSKPDRVKTARSTPSRSAQREEQRLLPQAGRAGRRVDRRRRRPWTS